MIHGSNSNGPGVSPGGASTYGVTSQDIDAEPLGSNTALSDVIAQMPGVAIDQNQQIHIRDTEGPQFQYQINGILVPFDINTNPPFVSMINPLFIDHMELLEGILPSQYSYATGGVITIQTKDGFSQPGGNVSMMVGQRDTYQPAMEYAGNSGKFSYYVNGTFTKDNTAFSSATPDHSAYHDRSEQGQGFGIFTYQVAPTAKLSLILSTSNSNNQLPNVPGQQPQFVVAGANPPASADIDSYLNFRDFLGMLALNGTLSPDLSYQLAYSSHAISQKFLPDNVGELAYQGVSSTATHEDIDNTLEGDFALKSGQSTYSTGFYLGEYHVKATDSSLVFPVDSNGDPTSTVPAQINISDQATNIVTGLYVNDLWRITDRMRINLGLRLDTLSGFTTDEQLDPTASLTYDLTKQIVVHAGFARYMQVPSFSGVAPSAPAAFANTTGAEPSGNPTPMAEHDSEWDAGVVFHPNQEITISQDNFYEVTRHYLDTGQFGVVPIFAPFNYDHGYIWGSELSLGYKEHDFSFYSNYTFGRNFQKGVDSGQFNFDPVELAYINSHYIPLDHQPISGIATGASYRWDSLTFSLDSTYSSGLRGGFADQDALPTVFQLNGSVSWAFEVPGVGIVSDRLTILNLLDKINLIRPSEGIGIFQSAYGPRFTVYDTLSLTF